jgi:hypothetical protein
VKRELERIEIPDEHEARERSWRMVSAAFAGREPQPRGRSWKPVLAIVAALVALAGLLSPPGRAVLDEIREVVGIERAQPALFSLPAPGGLLVTSDAGAWVVDRDGSKRLLGNYREASWSPFGAFIVAAKRNELAALEPDGDVRWTLARPDVRFARWGGTRTDTRIAYMSSGAQLRIVAGDGTGDRRLARRASSVAPAWRPGSAHVLTYAREDGFVRVVDAERGTVLSRSDARDVVEVDWVADRRLLVTPTRASLFDDSSQEVLRTDGRFTGGAISSRAQQLALVTVRDATSVVELVSRTGEVRQLFSGRGRLEGPVWSPDGRWVAIGWPDADQLVFIRTIGRAQIRAVSNVSRQFRSRTFPQIEGWCCAG